MEQSLLIKKNRGKFSEQKLVLTSSFKCDQIHYCHRYEFGHIVVLLKSDLNVHLHKDKLNVWSAISDGS
jgi:hypothetical protein